MKKYFERLGKKSKKAFEKKIDKDTKNKVLTHYALSINKYRKLILLQNKKDIDYAKKIGLKSNFPEIATAATISGEVTKAMVLGFPSALFLKFLLKE